MNKRIKKLWVEALRSGEYEQGLYKMKSHGKYCCLGVLQEVALKDGVKFEPERGPTCQLPSEVFDWADMALDDEEDFSELNDSGATFEQIALCIENGL